MLQFIKSTNLLSPSSLIHSLIGKEIQSGRAYWHEKDFSLQWWGCATEKSSPDQLGGLLLDHIKGDLNLLSLISSKCSYLSQVRSEWLLSVCVSLETKYQYLLFFSQFLTNIIICFLWNVHVCLSLQWMGVRLTFPMFHLRSISPSFGLSKEWLVLPLRWVVNPKLWQSDPIPSPSSLSPSKMYVLCHQGCHVLYFQN